MTRGPQPPVSRQRRWQKRRRAKGLCIRCGVKPLHTKNHCAECAAIQREYMRKRTGATTRYKAAYSYQKS